MYLCKSVDYQAIVVVLVYWKLR